MIWLGRSYRSQKRIENRDSIPILGSIILIGFGSLFLIVGLIAFFGMDTSNSEKQKAGTIVALVFTAIGLLIIFGGIALTKYSRQKQTLQKTFPGQSWRHRSDWAEDLIKTGRKSAAIGFTFFALFWNAISLPMSIIAISEEKIKGPGWLILLFPFVGALLLVGAIRQWMIYLKWGISTLRLENFPPRLNSMLSGQIELTRPISSIDPVQMILTCAQVTTTGSGKNRSTHRKVLFDAEQLVQASNLTSLPVEILIPGNQPRYATSSNSSIEWHLTVTAKTSGTDYTARFDLPVIDPDPNAPPPFPPDKHTRMPAMSLENIIRDPGIRITPRINAMHFEFSAARHKSGAFMLLLFAAIFNGVAAGTWIYGACIAIPIVMAIIGVLTFYGFLSSILTKSSFTVARSGIQGSARSVFGSRLINIPSTDIDLIEPVTRSQTNETTYFSIDLTTKDGRKQTIAHSIRGRTASQAIVDEIKKVLSR